MPASNSGLVATAKTALKSYHPKLQKHKFKLDKLYRVLGVSKIDYTLRMTEIIFFASFNLKHKVIYWDITKLMYIEFDNLIRTMPKHYHFRKISAFDYTYFKHFLSMSTP